MNRKITAVHDSILAIDFLIRFVAFWMILPVIVMGVFALLV
jgi:hypothetical protein